MFFGWFKKKQKTCLGIDLGATGIKIVELTKSDKDRLFLSNYVIAQTKMGSSTDVGKTDVDDMASLMQKVFLQAGIKTRQAVISLSVGETFSTIISVPNLSEDELVKAIPFEAKKYVPIPMEEVVLDWSVVGEYVDAKGSSADSLMPPAPAGAGEEKKQESFTGIKMLQILIVAVPQDIIRRISQIAKKTGLKVLAVEQEAFSIVRSLVGNDGGGYLVADIGQTNIDLIVMDKNSIRQTYTFDKIAPQEIANEVGKLMTAYQGRYNRKIGKIILTGGASSQSLAETLNVRFGVPCGVGDPFVRLAYDEKLGKSLKEIAPFMAVAVGGAMREI